MEKNFCGDPSTCFPSLEEVLEKGKACEWKKPDSSFCCGVVYWWHGWRERWCGDRRIIVRRLICSSCKKTMTLHPKELWPRFQVTSNQIIEACRKRIDHRQWVAGYSHSRIRWWVRVARRLLSVFKDLIKAVSQMFLKCPQRSPLSRYWLTHPTVP